jgi:hypothetical protein
LYIAPEIRFIKMAAPNHPVVVDGRFDDDPRVSFDKTAGKYQYEDDNGQEWEWVQSVWIPIVRAATLRSTVYVARAHVVGGRRWTSPVSRDVHRYPMHYISPIMFRSRKDCTRTPSLAFGTESSEGLTMLTG